MTCERSIRPSAPRCLCWATRAALLALASSRFGNAPRSRLSLRAQFRWGGTSYKNLFYIDGLTKSGMSGSPVVCLAKPGDEFHTEDGVRVSIEKAEPFLIGVYAGRDGVTQEEYELSLGRVWKISAVEALFYNRRANEVVSAS